ncbi:envelope glycoprotein UL132 [Cynomolgus macaque cytomegalovirus strain Ottawa]|uniref:Envelope glycoprotein UL132 n=1 Tax=macacine betaherpesvirus 8 TaxID=2560567 RepID=G8H0R8_9BETA|nr:envelope glycoprotein UL132 [Cynomolgus macaque cytomegalovirus strain Ottawa]AEQ32266.1 envelope glycoprotein UL132 [Cynomolgus macaque cytomegalovirus strain Ottawa]
MTNMTANNTTTANSTATVTTTAATTSNTTSVSTTVLTATTTAEPGSVLTELLGIIIYCASTVALLCLLLVLVAALYSTCHTRKKVKTKYSEQEAAKLIKSNRRSSPSSKKSRPNKSDYQQLWQSQSETDSTSDDDADNNVLYFDEKGNLTSFVNPQYGHRSSMMIESQADDDENIHYYMSIYNELAAEAMADPSESWEMPKVLQVSTREVTLKEPEYDN